ncbi:MAG: AAA family ATPase [Lachnospiraceae bacterium]|nr:AAA family ATPase [Lachnospiraceae bacterium]
MREGIAIVGLNGSGKSTLGHALAKKLGYYEIDVEDYYFPEQRESRRAALDGNYEVNCDYLGEIPYSVSRSKEEVELAIAKEIATHPKYIATGVTMNWSPEVLSTIKIVFWLKTDTDERMRRVKDREEKRWGSRVSEGGDMYEQQLSFRNLIAGFTETKVADSVAKIGCKVIELDGTLPVKENVEIIKNNISGETYR